MNHSHQGHGESDRDGFLEHVTMLVTSCWSEPPGGPRDARCPESPSGAAGPADTFAEYLEETQRKFGWRRFFVKLLAPLVMRFILRDSPCIHQT
jgi:hypothetical protein